MSDPLRTVLLIDGDPRRAGSVQSALSPGGIEARHFTNRGPALAALADEGFDAIVVGRDLTDASALELIRELVAGWSDIPVVALLAGNDVTEATSAVSAGAVDYLHEGFDPAEILFTVKKAIAAGDVAAQAPPAPPPNRGEPKVASRVMQEVFETARRVAQGTATVMIRGESGVGKEVIARRLHVLSPRRDRPFVKVHCAALPEQILESELFGYEKGAFTGAVTRKPGRVELAEHGTLFLDEIGDVSPTIQVKLLRILQDKEYERLGGTRTLRADVRFVAATHRNLERMIKKGEFREDLYYRLNVVRVDVPPLRERLEDIEHLVAYFFATFAQEHGKPLRLAPEAVGLLKAQRWPGNVRQLQNFIERLVVLTDGPLITLNEVQGQLEREVGAFATSDMPSEVSVIELDAAVRQAERRAIQKALKRAGGDRTLAARILGVSRRTLFYKLREYQLGSE
jgi:two-component system, NtrC family, response regulator AtoC